MYHAHRQMEGVVDSGGHGRDGSLVARICPNRRSRSRKFHLASFGPSIGPKTHRLASSWASTRTEPSPWNRPAIELVEP